MKTNNILRNFEKLTYAQQSEMLETLKQTLSKSKPILQHKKLNKECIYCHKTKVYKHGTYKNGGTRFRCQDCKRSYNELTGTSIHRIKKKELWDRYIELMFQSKSLEYIANELDINFRTAFLWRHKILSSFENLFTKEFKGIVETDDVFFDFNQKGRKKKRHKIFGAKQGASDYQVSVMGTMDRYRTFDFKVIKLGAVNSAILGEKMKDTLLRLNSENVICSDRSRALGKFIRTTGLTHRTIISKKGKNVDGIYHVNTLNGSVNLIKRWIGQNFINVSTKYLKNYLNWYVMLEMLEDSKKRNDKFWDFTLVDNKTWERNREIENEYQKILKIA